MATLRTSAVCLRFLAVAWAANCLCLRASFLAASASAICWLVADVSSCCRQASFLAFCADWACALLGALYCFDPCLPEEYDFGFCLVLTNYAPCIYCVIRIA